MNTGLYVCVFFFFFFMVFFGYMPSTEIETEQDSMILHHPLMPSACLLPVENSSQRTSLIREIRNAETKENSLRRLNNSNVVIKHSQGPLVLSQGL